MDRKEVYEKYRSALLNAAQNPFVQEKKEIDTRKLSFEDMWESMGKEKFTGYITSSTSEYKWHTLLIDGHVRFSIFLGKGITLQGKEAILSMKSKWTNPPTTVVLFKLSKPAVESYFGLFSGLKVYDGINPETIGMERIFQKLTEEKFTGPVLFDTKNDKLIFLWHSGKILNIVSSHNILSVIDDEVLDRVMLSPFLSVTAIKAHTMSFNVPAEKLLYTKRATEFNEILKCVQNKLKGVLGTRIMTLIANDVRDVLTKRHMFYSRLIQIKDYGISIEAKVLDKGINRDLDEVLKEIIEVYAERSKEDTGAGLIARFFKECKTKGVEDSEEGK